MLAVFQHLFAIHENVNHAGRVLVWLNKGGVILNCVGIEHDNIRVEALL